MIKAKIEKINTQTYEEYYELANINSDFRIARKGDTLDVDSVEAEFVHPPAGHTGEIHDLNLVLNVDFEGQSILLTGDVETPSEEMMAESVPELIDSDILKVGHHGSYTSTEQGFLEVVDPDAAVIQVGEDNRYGHPHDETLQRLQNHGIKIYRNDYHGDVVMTLDGDSWSANVEPWDEEIDEDPADEPDDEIVEEPVGEVNINNASLEELQEIVYIGESRAEEIIELRLLESLDELTQVHGIAEGKLEDIKEEGVAFVE